jgi:hypothetical protein
MLLSHIPCFSKYLDSKPVLDFMTIFGGQELSRNRVGVRDTPSTTCPPLLSNLLDFLQIRGGSFLVGKLSQLS